MTAAPEALMGCTSGDALGPWRGLAFSLEVQGQAVHFLFKEERSQPTRFLQLECTGPLLASNPSLITFITVS